MYLIHEKTEVLLNNFIEQIKPKPQSWRLISIEFQESTTLHSPLFQNLCMNSIGRFFDQSDCRIFWYKPGFILIFFQGRAMPIEKCVENFLKETEFKGFGRFFDILDLSIHWNDLITLVTRIKSIKNLSTQEPVQDPNKTTDANIKTAQKDLGGFTIELSKEKINQLKPIRKSRVRPLLLLVEDDPFTLQLVKLAFKDGFDVITAETARQALSYYQRHLPDMVFLDIQLPDGNGVNLLQQMVAADSQSYIIMLSSHSQKEKILECMNHGAKGFIAKPFTRQRLVDAAEKFKSTQTNSTSGNNRHGT